MIAYDKNGTVFAMRENEEILVHDGPSEGPLWRKKLDMVLCGVGADSEHVVAVTGMGKVYWFAARTGDEKKTAQINGGIPRLAIVDMPRQRVIALTRTSIIALEGDKQTTLADIGASAAGLDPDGNLLAVTASELVTIARDGTRTTTNHTLGTLNAVAWHPAGFWMLGAPAKIYRWSGSDEPTHVTSLPNGANLDSIACHAKAIALAWNKNMVVSLEWPSKETLGSLKYPERKVEGIDFGPWPWLGVALDLGDGNKHNLEEPERLHRSDTHPGRDHHSWLVAVGGSSKDEGASASAPPPSSGPRREAPPPAETQGNPYIGIAAIVAIGFLIIYLVR